MDGEIHAFLYVDTARALATAAAIDAKIAAGERLGPLAGVPLALKDVFTYAGAPTTCGSRILAGLGAAVLRRRSPSDCWTPDIVILGKTNMDEFAMGSSTENSAFGPTHNPWDTRADPGRVRRRLGGGAGRVRGAAGHRHRHRRLDPAARRGHRHGRGQADLRRHLPLRGGGDGLQPGHPRPMRPQRARRRPAARGDRRPRPARLDLDRRPGAGRGRRRPRPATSRACGSAWSRSSPATGTRPGVEQRFARGGRPAGGAGRGGRRGVLPALRLRPAGLLPDHAQRGVVEPRPVRRDALRAAGGRRRAGRAPRR